MNDVTARAGPPLLVPHIGRGLAVGDLDNDGRVDAVLVAQNEPLVYLHNRTDGRPFLTIALEGTASNRDGVGARVVVEAGGIAPGRRSDSAAAATCRPATDGSISAWVRRPGSIGSRSAGRRAGSIRSGTSPPTRDIASGKVIPSPRRCRAGPAGRNGQARRLEESVSHGRNRSGVSGPAVNRSSVAPHPIEERLLGRISGEVERFAGIAQRSNNSSVTSPRYRIRM